MTASAATIPSSPAGSYRICEQHGEAAEQQDRAGCQRDARHEHRHDSGKRDDRNDRERQRTIVDKKPNQLAQHVGQNDHGKTSALGRRTTATATLLTARNNAANATMARSAPGQSTPSPSPVQNTPKADNITPTANFRVFSGTRASGRCTTNPTQATSRQAASAPALAGNNIPRPALSAITMNTTSSPSSSTALKLARPASQSSRASWRLACSRSPAVSVANAVASSWSGMMPAERRIALRSQRIPNSSSRTPITSCSRCSGTRSSKGPSATTISASTTRPVNAPSPAGRQPRTVATASTMVRASTASTSEARNAASIAGQTNAKPLVTRYLQNGHAKEACDPVVWTRSNNRRPPSSAIHLRCRRKAEPRANSGLARLRHGRKTKERCRCKTPLASSDRI